MRDQRHNPYNRKRVATIFQQLLPPWEENLLTTDLSQQHTHFIFNLIGGMPYEHTTNG